MDVSSQWSGDIWHGMHFQLLICWFIQLSLYRFMISWNMYLKSITVRETIKKKNGKCKLNTVFFILQWNFQYLSLPFVFMYFLNRLRIAGSIDKSWLLTKNGMEVNSCSKCHKILNFYGFIVFSQYDEFSDHWLCIKEKTITQKKKLFWALKCHCQWKYANMFF